jgi:hypothetical protein
MTIVLPNGYLTLLEAADVLSEAIYVGVPDPPDVIELRNAGFEIGSGSERDRAIAEIWKGVDKSTLRASAIGGRPRRIVRLDAKLTQNIPALRSPRGRGFTSLRQSNPAYNQLASWFGELLHTAVLAFRETDVQKLARRLMRARRTAQKAGGLRGRRSFLPEVQNVIADLVDQQKWNATMSIKALATGVNRTDKLRHKVSDSTVVRALDQLCEQTKDRRFDRKHHQRRKRRKASR